MSRENVEIMRVLYDRLNQTGEPSPATYAADATFDASRLPGFGIYRGFDECYAAWLPHRDAFDQCSRS
jgi:hypothetical protein